MKKEEITSDKAKEVLTQERKDRSDKCAKEIQEVLTKHKCSLQVAMIATQEGNRFSIEFVATE